MTLDLLTFGHLSAEPWLTHAVTSRHGGVSQGRCATLNTSFSVGDDEDRVETNLHRVAEAVGSERERLFGAYQVHGNGAVVVDGATERGPRCDVLLANSPERTLMLRFADCTPILLADPETRAVAVVHAGWRGTAVRAGGAAVEAMRQAFGTEPKDVLAGIGPAIGPCCYTVGEDVAEAFADRVWALLRDERGAVRLDLWEASRRGLMEAGVPPEQIELAGVCTQCHADRFFSHRANGGQPAGRFAAVIGLRS